MDSQGRRGWKNREKMECGDHRRAWLQRAWPAPDIRGPGSVVVLNGKFFGGGVLFIGDSQ